MFLRRKLVSTASNFFHTSAKLACDKEKFVVPTKDMLKEKYPNVFFGCFGNPNSSQCPSCNKSDNHNYERYVKLCEEYKTSDKLIIEEDLDNGLKVFGMK